jgi:hypothetical protein
MNFHLSQKRKFFDVMIEEKLKAAIAEFKNRISWMPPTMEEKLDLLHMK